MTIPQLRTRLVETALAWQLAVDQHRLGRAEETEVNTAAIAHYNAVRAYRAATR